MNQELTGGCGAARGHASKEMSLERKGARERERELVQVSKWTIFAGAVLKPHLADITMFSTESALLSDTFGQYDFPLSTIFLPPLQTIFNGTDFSQDTALSGRSIPNIYFSCVIKCDKERTLKGCSLNLLCHVICL